MRSKRTILFLACILTPISAACASSSAFALEVRGKFAGVRAVSGKMIPPRFDSSTTWHSASLTSRPSIVPLSPSVPDAQAPEAPATTDTRVAETECDHLAGDPEDPRKAGPGINFDKISADEAVRACRNAVQHHPDIHRFEFQLGRALLAAKQGGEAVRWLRKAAEAGHAFAMIYLGNAHSSANPQVSGVAKDNAEALRWYRSAAETGEGEGLLAMGLVYVNGTGVIRDPAAALDWFRKAAATGNVKSIVNIGVMYRSGLGVRKDYYEAVRWFRKAAEKGSEHGYSSLADMYQLGWGVRKDLREAMRLYRKAADKGDARAMVALGKFYEQGNGVRKDEWEAFHWYRKAADEGNAVAMGNVGGMYYDGRGAPKDPRKAAEWWFKADKKGEPYSQTFLARSYELGIGVAKDPQTAATYMLKAIKGGAPIAIDAMTRNSAAWSEAFRREFQRLLRAEGVYDGAIDGSFGPSTRSAITALASRNAKQPVR